MTHDKAGRRKKRWSASMARLALILAVALSTPWFSPLPALAETGSTELYVERADGEERASGGKDDADQQRATVASGQRSPQTGDGTNSAIAVVLAAGGAGATVAGSAIRRRRRRTMPTIPYGKGRHETPRDDSR